MEPPLARVRLHLTDTMITQGYLSRHFWGKRQMADSALLDVVQDYALKFLYDHGLFDIGAVLKSGTSLRKFRAGNAGRFSTDLDFATPDVDTGELLWTLSTALNCSMFTSRSQVPRHFAPNL